MCVSMRTAAGKVITAQTKRNGEFLQMKEAPSRLSSQPALKKNTWGGGGKERELCLCISLTYTCIRGLRPKSPSTTTATELGSEKNGRRNSHTHPTTTAAQRL